MKNVNATLKGLLLAATVIGLVDVSSLCGETKSWKDETVLISPRGDQTVVRPLEGDKVLFKNADPQRAIEWGLANARTTVVLAGKYVVSDRIDIPRDDVTLIIDQGAEIAPDPDATGCTYIGFRPEGSWNCLCIIYNHGHDDVRVINFGTIPWWSRQQKGQRGILTWPIFYDGRNEKRTCGVEGGMILSTGFADNTAWLVDCRGVDVPLMTRRGDSFSASFRWKAVKTASWGCSPT